MNFSSGFPLLYGCLLSGCVAFGLSRPVSAQQKGGRDFVAGEIQERELALLDANGYLSQGDALQAEGKLKEAVGFYRAAVDVLPANEKAGGIRRTALDRYGKAATKYAQQLINQAHAKEAKVILEEVLSPERAPDYQPAKDVLAKIADPDWVIPGDTPTHRKKIGQVDQLLGEAFTVLRQGKFTDASTKYSEVLTIDPYNSAARDGLARVAKEQQAYDESAADHTRAEMLADLGSKWALGKPRRLGVGALPEDTGEVAAGGRSDAIGRKLRTIVFDQINFQDTTLEQVIGFLVARSRELDPDKRGVDIVLGNETTIERNRPVTLKLSQVPMLEVLRYVCEAVNAQFLIEPSAVRITSASGQNVGLLTRRFSVPPDFFQGLSTGDAGAAVADPFAAGAGNANGQPTARRVSPQESLQGAGISFPEGALAQYVPSSSQLIVRNTYSNLQLIEQLVSASQQSGTKQVYLEVRMLDVVESRLEEIGYDWLVDGFEVNTKNDVLVGGGQVVSEDVAKTFAFKDPVTGEAFGGQRVTGGLRSGVDALGLDGLDQIIGAERSLGMLEDATGPGILSAAGMLTDPQFQAVIRGLNQHSGLDVLVEPKIVTKSGQRAKVYIGQEFLYPTEYDPPELPQQVSATGAGLPVTPAHPTTFVRRLLGFNLEIEPVIGPDNYTLDVSLASEFTEFEGFVNYGSPISVSAPSPIPGAPALDLLITQNQILMPVFKTRRLPASNVSIYDGATLVIGGLSDSRIDKVLDKVPVLGDLPFIGSFFRSDLERKKDRVVVFFLTARIIDTTGAPFNGPAIGQAPAEQAAP